MLQNSKLTHTAQKTAVPRQVKMYKHIHKDETQQIKMRIWERGTFSWLQSVFVSLSKTVARGRKKEGENDKDWE